MKKKLTNLDFHFWLVNGLESEKDIDDYKMNFNEIWEAIEYEKQICNGS